jgi:hypothetical protein
MSIDAQALQAPMRDAARAAFDELRRSQPGDGGGKRTATG